MKCQLRSVVHSRKPGIQFRSQARRSVERDDVTARSVGGDNLEVSPIDLVLRCSWNPLRLGRPKRP
jgi:hypothetical protein